MAVHHETVCTVTVRNDRDIFSDVRKSVPVL